MLIALSGPSGIGKGFIKEKLLREYPDIKEIQWITTRKLRSTESRSMSKIYTIDVHCTGCRSTLYRYRKEGGDTLIKCYADMITKDHTAGDLRCQNCKQEFARIGTVHNRPAHIIIRGRVFVRGHHG